MKEEGNSRKDFRYRTHLDMTEPEEVYYWSKALNVTPTQLFEAVLATKSNKIEDIRSHLEKGQSDER